VYSGGGVGVPPGVNTNPLGAERGRAGRAPISEGASERPRPPLTNYRNSETSGLKLAFRGLLRLFGARFWSKIRAKEQRSPANFARRTSR